MKGFIVVVGFAGLTALILYGMKVLKDEYDTGYHRGWYDADEAWEDEWADSMSDVEYEEVFGPVSGDDFVEHWRNVAEDQGYDDHGDAWYYQSEHPYGW